MFIGLGLLLNQQSKGAGGTAGNTAFALADSVDISVPVLSVSFLDVFLPDTEYMIEAVVRTVNFSSIISLDLVDSLGASVGTIQGNNILINDGSLTTQNAAPRTNTALLTTNFDWVFRIGIRLDSDGKVTVIQSYSQASALNDTVAKRNQGSRSGAFYRVDPKNPTGFKLATNNVQIVAGQVRIFEVLST